MAESLRRRAGRLSSAVGDDMSERLPVANDKVTAALVENAPVAPRGQLHAHALARYAEHGRELGVGNAQSSFPRRAVVVRQADQLLGQSGGKIQEGGVGNVLGR